MLPKTILVCACVVLWAGTVENRQLLRTDMDPNLNNVLYYGWFLDETTASSVKKYTDEIFKTLYEVPNVREFMDKVRGEVDPFKYFVKPVDPNTSAYDPFYHITAMYCCDGADCTEYHKMAKDSLGKTFETHLIGFYFTERTFGVRVNLTTVQEPLFDKEESVVRRGQKSSKVRSNDLEKLESVVGQGQGSTRSTDPDYPGITFVPQPPNFKPSYLKAHITLGCASGVPAVETGYDLLDIIEYEVKPDTHTEDDVQDVGTLWQFHKEDTAKTAFVLYPEQKLVVDAVFKAYETTSASIIARITKKMLLLTTLISFTYI